MRRSLLRLALLSLFLRFCNAPLSANPAPLWTYNLKTEYQSEPLAIEAPQPRLSWMLRSYVRGQKQTAYRILVARSKETLKADFGDMWDSGKVTGSQSLHVEYAGKPLGSGAVCYWKVRVWDKDGKPSHWPLVNEKIAALPKLAPNCAFVESTGLKAKSDTVHFDTPSLREFGTRYAEAMKKLQAQQTK